MFLPQRLPGQDWLGVVIAIPEPWVSELTDLRLRLGDLQGSRVPAHITLMPPVPVATESRGEVIEHLSAIARRSRPFRVALRGADCFRPLSPVAFRGGALLLRPGREHPLGPPRLRAALPLPPARHARPGGRRPRPRPRDRHRELLRGVVGGPRVPPRPPRPLGRLLLDGDLRLRGHLSPGAPPPAAGHCGGSRLRGRRRRPRARGLRSAGRRRAPARW